MTIIYDLRQKVKDAEQLVVDTKIMREEMRSNVKFAEKSLKNCKRDFNRSDRNWHHARRLVLKAKSKLSRYPREARIYAKKHMDKVFAILEGEK